MEHECANFVQLWLKVELIRDESIDFRCSKCNAPFEEFSEEELGMCVIILSTFIHREPTLAASILPEILRFNSKQVYLIFCILSE